MGAPVFCNEDGSRIGFDPHARYTHRCPLCETEYEGEPYDCVWFYFYQNLAILTALKSATVYRATLDDRYIEHAKTILTLYAENYTRFVLHTKEDERFDSYESMSWGCGRIMPQGLNESIIGIRMILTMQLLDAVLDGDYKQTLYTQIFSPCAPCKAPGQGDS